MTESLRTITATVSPPEITVDLIETICPPLPPGAGVRKDVPMILYLRYTGDSPLTMRYLAQKFGVTFQRIEQIIRETLDWMAQNGKSQELPPNTRLRAAIERRQVRSKAA
jgi:hypothetical protein